MLDREEKFRLEEYKAQTSKLLSLQNTRSGMMFSALFVTGAFYAYLPSPLMQLSYAPAFCTLIFIPPLFGCLAFALNASINHSIAQRVAYLAEIEQ